LRKKVTGYPFRLGTTSYIYPNHILPNVRKLKDCVDDVELILILGGSRSGKSRKAVELAQPYKRKIFLATGVATDEEMRQRIARHQMERGPDWRTIEEPYEIVQTLDQAMHDFDVILLDCLTFWLSNLLLQEEDKNTIPDELSRLTALLRRREAAFIIVSNEVGMGVVPERSLGRRFRDHAGFANQRIAAIADVVILMVAGHPVQVK